MKWEPIRPFEYSGELQGTSELESLKVVWAFYQELYGPDVTASLQTRFNREWSIETGQIEGAYDLDRGVTETLLDQGFKESLISRQRNGKSAKQVASILRDQLEAIEGLFDFVRTEELSLSYIKELHQQLMRSEPTYTVYSPERIPIEKPLEKGMYKREPNNPFRPDGAKHEYCPPEHTAREMERLVDIYNEQRELPIEVQAAWLHHAFTQIHPFQDGNGRVARALASLVLIKARLCPFVVFREDRGRYVGHLEAADGGELAGLIEFFRRSQRNAILRTSEYLNLTVAKHPSTSDTVRNLLASIKQDLVQRGDLPRDEWRETEHRMRRLLDEYVTARLGSLKADAELTFGTDARFEIKEQVIKFKPNYPNELTAVKGVYLALRKEKESKIGFVALVPKRFRGLSVLTSVYQTPSGENKLIGSDFLVNWVEGFGEVDQRFRAWLEDHLKEGLNLWRQDL